MASFTEKAMASAFMLAFAIPTFLFVPCALADLQRVEHAPKSDGSLSLLVVGDWGRKGEYNQSQVATQVIFAIFNYISYNFCA